MLKKEITESIEILEKNIKEIKKYKALPENTIDEVLIIKLRQRMKDFNSVIEVLNKAFGELG